jgi:plasmid stabilization system protein ParE
MSRSLWSHPEAESELNDAADYYALQSPGLDRKLIAEIEKALSQIVAFPEAPSPVNARTRRKVLLGHPYSLMYSVTGAQIRILSVAHHACRPFYRHGRDQVPV